MKRPIIDSGEARVLIYASKAGRNVTAMDLIKACENRIVHIKQVLQKDGRMATRVDKVATPMGDIEIVVRWQKLGEKRTKHFRRAQKQALDALTADAQKNGEY